MNIIGTWKAKKIGMFDEEIGTVMRTIEEIMAMEETDEIIEVKQMLTVTVVFSEGGKLEMRIVVPPEEVEAALADGAVIAEDGSTTMMEAEWKIENGEIFYNLGDEGEIDGEPIDPWIKADYDEDGCLVMTNLAFEKA